MAYIGNSPANIGNYQIVDDIASGFNGSLVSFALASGGIAITPAKSGQILANINGVMQEPDDGGTNGFKVTGSNIVFSSAPANGDTFWAVYQGQNVDIGTPSDDVVDTAHIKDDAVTAAKLANSINTAIAANTAKTGITTSQASAITANTAKTGITSSQATAITAALPKAGGTMTGNIAHAGDFTLDIGGDIILDADGADVILKDGGTSFLEIDKDGNNARIKNPISDGDVLIQGSDAGSIITALTLDMSNGGQAVFSKGATFNDHVYFQDNNKAVFGGGDDLQIYHNGSASYIDDVGTGNLNLRADAAIAFQNSGGTEEFARFISNGAVELNHNDAKKLETTANGIAVTGTVETPDIYSNVSNAQFTNQYSCLVVYTNGDAWEKKLRLNFGSVSSWGAALVSVRFMYNYGTSLDVLYHVQSHAAAGSLTVSVASGNAGSGTRWTTETTNQYNLELKCGSALNSGALITVCSGTRANQQLVSTLI